MNDEQNGQNGERRRFTGQQKVAILREHFIEQVPVSAVCDKHGLNPTAFYRWQKEFFENGAAAFEGRTGKADGRTRQLEERVEKLQAKLGRKDEVIAELMEDHVRLKKSLGES
jgi:transposase-like protein